MEKTSLGEKSEIEDLLVKKKKKKIHYISNHFMMTALATEGTGAV